MSHCPSVHTLASLDTLLDPLEGPRLCKKVLLCCWLCFNLQVENALSSQCNIPPMCPPKILRGKKSGDEPIRIVYQTWPCFALGLPDKLPAHPWPVQACNSNHLSHLSFLLSTLQRNKSGTEKRCLFSVGMTERWHPYISVDWPIFTQQSLRRTEDVKLVTHSIRSPSSREDSKIA